MHACMHARTHALPFLHIYLRISFFGSLPLFPFPLSISPSPSLPLSPCLPLLSPPTPSLPLPPSLPSPLHLSSPLPSSLLLSLSPCLPPGVSGVLSDLVVNRGQHCLWSTGGGLRKCPERLLQEAGRPSHGHSIYSLCSIEGVNTKLIVIEY